MSWVPAWWGHKDALKWKSTIDSQRLDISTHQTHLFFRAQSPRNGSWYFNHRIVVYPIKTEKGIHFLVIFQEHHWKLLSNFMPTTRKYRGKII